MRHGPRHGLTADPHPHSNYHGPQIPELHDPPDDHLPPSPAGRLCPLSVWLFCIALTVALVGINQYGLLKSHRAVQSSLKRNVSISLPIPSISPVTFSPSSTSSPSSLPSPSPSVPSGLVTRAVCQLSVEYRDNCFYDNVCFDGTKVSLLLHNNINTMPKVHDLIVELG